MPTVLPVRKNLTPAQKRRLARRQKLAPPKVKKMGKVAKKKRGRPRKKA